MSNDYPFSPYPDPFSPLAPTPAPSPEPPRAQPAAWPAQQPQARQASEPAQFPSAAPPIQTFSTHTPPVTKADTAEPPATFSDEDTNDEAAQKTALAIVAGVLILLMFVGFGVWYFLREPTVPQPTEEQNANLILAATGGKIITPEGAALVIPPGAFAEDTKLEISKVREGDVTDLFELKPLGQKFLKPVTVEIPYKKSGPIILEYWKEEGGKRRELEYVRDEKEKKLRTEVKEF